MKEKLKVYHGLPSSPTNENTSIYCSFNGRYLPEICTSYKLATNAKERATYKPDVCGYNMRSSVYEKKSMYEFNGKFKNEGKIFTLDYWVDASMSSDSDMAPNSNGAEHYGAYLQHADTSNAILRFLTLHKMASNGQYSNLIRIYERNTSKSTDVYVPIIKEKSNHFRITRNDNTITIYVNGKMYYQNTFAEGYLFPIDKPQINIYSLTLGLSDVHLIEEDLEDFFPTLPQDFIDGKAIVVPALNQRQSYGDPVLHQVTELLVPANNDGENHYPTLTSDELFWQSKSHVELGVNDAVSWGNGTGIRIIGLENSLITGVYDTDTAKCRITKTVTNTKIVPVSSVTGISVGDKLQYVNASNFTTSGSSYNYTVESVDSVNKTITLSSTTSWYVGDFFFETTASSSSPVVKTVDGTTVNGTWSGLGTYQATFTFGSNSNIAGKDLVVTYCLNARGDVSPYPKMPSEVIRGYDELGNELVPVSSVIFKDDFRHKVQGNLNVCPHYASFRADTTLLMPNSFTPDSYIDYTKLYTQDGEIISLSNTTQINNISQALFSFNVLSLLKTKIGKDDLTVQQAINLIKTINFNVYGYGYGNGSHALKTTVFVDSSMWSNTVSTHTKSTVTHLLRSTDAIHNIIDSNGLTHFLVYTNTCGSTHSTLFLDYANIELVLKTEERFTYLALDEEDIDRSKKCNPILVDMQTKEVKRLLPSTAPFSTEVLTYNSGNITSLSNCTLITQSNTHMLTTMGTGSSDPFVENQYRGLLGKLDLAYFNSADYLGEPAHRLPLGANTSRFSLGCKFVLSQPYMENMNFFQVSEVFPNVNQLAIKHGIVKKDTELYLRLLVLGIKANSLDYTSNIQYYKLPNRPLIK